MRLPIFQTVLGGLTVKGSIVGTHHDLEEVFELHRRGRTRVERVERELDDVNEAIAQVLDGSAPAPRMVFRMAEVPSFERSTRERARERREARRPLQPNRLPHNRKGESMAVAVDIPTVFAAPGEPGQRRRFEAAL